MLSRKITEAEVMRYDEHGHHPEPRLCVCGGSGWTPGYPDPDPCPYHAEPLVLAHDALELALNTEQAATLGARRQVEADPTREGLDVARHFDAIRFALRRLRRELGGEAQDEQGPELDKNLARALRAAGVELSTEESKP